MRYKTMPWIFFASFFQIFFFFDFVVVEFVFFSVAAVCKIFMHIH